MSSTLDRIKGRTWRGFYITAPVVVWCFITRGINLLGANHDWYGTFLPDAATRLERNYSLATSVNYTETWISAPTYWNFQSSWQEWIIAGALGLAIVVSPFYIHIACIGLRDLYRHWFNGPSIRLSKKAV